MKCFISLLFALLAIFLLTPAATEGEYNYLISAYNYAVAIRHNFDDATDYYLDYLSQELKKISDKITERLAVALDELTVESDPALGRGVSTCADSAAFTIQKQQSQVHNELLVLGQEGNKLHQAINEKMMETNMMLLPMEDFYYRFTDRMFITYMKLNDDILPKLMYEIVKLVEDGDEIYKTLDNCLKSIHLDLDK